MANIELVERLLRERYNVASLDGLGPLSGAVQAARAGDLAPLTQALDERELYRWREPIEAALAEVGDESAVVAEPEPVSEFDAPAETEGEPEQEEEPAPRTRGRRRSDSPEEPTS